MLLGDGRGINHTSYRKAGLKACLVSVSGGVDSAVTLALMKHAQKRQGSPIEKVLGMYNCIPAAGSRRPA